MIPEIWFETFTGLSVATVAWVGNCPPKWVRNLLFAVPSLVSLYLLASSPTYFGGTLAKSQLRKDRIIMAKNFLIF